MEQEPLLPPSPQHSESEQHANPTTWKASPYWLIPVVMGASMARGMTLAPHIQVYTDIACRALDITQDSCASSPDAQARAARIQASITTVMSVLSAIATGPWSRWGDLNGRRPLLFLTLSGALSMELVFILITRVGTVYYKYAEQFIMVGPVLDGLVGGLSAFNGVIHAYTSDCTEHGSRAKIFSTLQGMVFIGLALGPWAAGIILSLTNASPYILFFVSASLLVLLLCFVAFICPESIQKDYQLLSEGSPTIGGRRPKLSIVKHYLSQFGEGLMSPVVIFTPRRNLLSGVSGRDWNVTYVGSALFLYLISIGVYQIKYIYGKHVYSWTSTQLGFYMSLLWISRAFNLLVLLPIIISYFKPKPRNGEQPSIHSELLFDKILAQTSLFIDGTADALIALAPSSSQNAFIALSCMSSFTSGGNPTLHSLGAVCLHASGRSSEVGSLFGAMAVLSAIAHTISPALYALTYGSTVTTFPKAIFYLAAALLGSAVLLLHLVRTKTRGSIPSYNRH